ncbi:hypothetical protein [Gordonia sputi]
MSHDPDNSHGAAADDEARSRPDEHSTSSTAEPDSDGTDECRRNPEERCEDDSEVGQLEHDLDTAEAALEGEIVTDPPSPRRVRQSKWKAPLPPPEALAAYNAIDPSFAERIVRSYERQIEIAERREDSINTAVDAQVRIQGMLASADVSLTKRGQWMLYSIAVFSLVAAVVFVVLGSPIAAVVSVILGVLSLSVNLVTTVSAVKPPTKRSNGQEVEDDSADSDP